MIAEKCKKRFGWGKHAPGEWSDEGSVWHITKNGKKTLCGCRVGTEEKGWFIWHFDESGVNCKKCLKIDESTNIAW